MLTGPAQARARKALVRQVTPKRHANDCAAALWIPWLRVLRMHRAMWPAARGMQLAERQRLFTLGVALRLYTVLTAKCRSLHICECWLIRWSAHSVAGGSGLLCWQAWLCSMRMSLRNLTTARRHMLAGLSLGHLCRTMTSSCLASSQCARRAALLRLCQHPASMPQQAGALSSWMPQTGTGLPPSTLAAKARRTPTPLTPRQFPTRRPQCL